MKSNYNYYIKHIKPLEKKYNKFCLLYNLFKWPYFYSKKSFYNKLLIKYYKTSQNSQKLINTLEKRL